MNQLDLHVLKYTLSGFVPRYVFTHIKCVFSLTRYSLHSNRSLDVITAPTYFTDGGAVKVLLSAFRELCGLLWFLHVRDQLSKYLRLLQPSPLKVSNFMLLSTQPF